MLGIIGAMDEEVNALIESLVNKSETTIAGFKYCQGKLNDTEVIVVKSGIGKVNMAGCTQAMIDNFKPNYIINTGIAGALDSRLESGDIVVSTDVIYHDMNVEGLGYEVGVIPDMETSVFKANDNLNKIVLDKLSSQDLGENKIYQGRICSGDQFISSKEVKDSIIKNVNGMCAEMEGAAMGHICYINKTPFTVIRTISDKADGSAHIDYPTFKIKTCKISVDLIKAICKND